MQTLASAYAAGPQSFGSLAPGARIYVIWSNAWDSTGNQNTLQNQWIQVDTFMTGQTRSCLNRRRDVVRRYAECTTSRPSTTD